MLILQLTQNFSNFVLSYSDWDEHPNPAHVEPEVRPEPEIPIPDAQQPEVEVAAAGGLTTVRFDEIFTIFAVLKSQYLIHYEVF